MAERGGVRLADRWMRSLHLYTGLFLAPWIAVYAVSAFCLNHHAWFLERLNLAPPTWGVVQRVDFAPGDGFPGAPEEQAEAILKRLDLQGAHRIQGKPTPAQMTILRISGGGNYRITWRRRSLLVVERQQPFSVYRLIHFLHFRAGYGQPYLSHLLWAVLVDVVAIAMGFWVISGIYLWARRPRQRLLGGAWLAAGSLLFIVLVIMLCR